MRSVSCTVFFLLRLLETKHHRANRQNATKKRQPNEMNTTMITVVLLSEEEGGGGAGKWGELTGDAIFELGFLKMRVDCVEEKTNSMRLFIVVVCIVCF